MLYLKILSLLLLGLAAQAFSLNRVELPSLITQDGPAKFYLDENFKRHHPALLDCADLSYMLDLRRVFKSSDTAFSWSFNFCHECVVSDVPGFLAKSDEIIEARTAALAARGYKIQSLDAGSDKPLVFAYEAQSNTLVIALSGLDLFFGIPDSESKFISYSIGNKKDHGLVSPSILIRTTAEFKGVVLPTFMTFWSTLTVEDRESLTVIFAGHAFGAGRAIVHATLLGEVFSGKEFYGDSFAGSNMIQVYSLCAPCVGNQEFTEYVHDLLGCDNIIQQKVIVDESAEAQAAATRAAAAGWLATLKHPHKADSPVIGWLAYDKDCAFLRRSIEGRLDRSIEENLVGWIEPKKAGAKAVEERD